MHRTEQAADDPRTMVDWAKKVAALEKKVAALSDRQEIIDVYRRYTVSV